MRFITQAKSFYDKLAQQRTFMEKPVSKETDFVAMQKVTRYSLYAAGAGLVPVPVFDTIAISGVQVYMLKELAGYYGVPFKNELGKSMVASLIGGLVPTSVGYGIVGSMIKRVPMVGTLIGGVTVGLFASASTYAIGRVFIQHFASGGTFLDFKPEEVRAYFNAEFSKARASA